MYIQYFSMFSKVLTCGGRKSGKSRLATVWNFHTSAFGRLAAAASRKFGEIGKNSRSLVVTMWRAAAFAAARPGPFAKSKADH